MVNACSEVGGWFKLTAAKVDQLGNIDEGSRRVVADWFPNLITNFGLEQMGNVTGYLNGCAVGSGATPPNVNDTALGSQIAFTSTRQGWNQGAQPTAPYYIWARTTYRFASGAAAGNLSEIGIKLNNATNLFSRALILDGAGNPTTVTVASDEVLDATYELRVYPFTDDKTGTVTFTGSKGLTHDYVLRCSQVNVNSSGAWTHGSLAQGIAQNESRGVDAYTGGLGTILQTPSGTSFGARAATALAYEANSKTGKIQLDVPINTWTGSLRSFQFRIGCGCFQIELTPPIEKLAGDVIQMTFFHTWARRP